MNRRHFLVSVGTSIVKGYNDAPGHSGDRTIDERQLGGGRRGFPGHDRACRDSARWQYYSNAWKCMCSFIDRIAAGVAEDGPTETIAKVSAEMSTLLLWRDEGGELRPPGPDDAIDLVATDTPEGHFCAHAIKHLVEKCFQPGPAILVECGISGLVHADDDRFAGTGLPNFIHHVVSRIRTLKKPATHGTGRDAVEVILIPTGGYKALIPYMVIAGMLEGAPNRYVYEKSTQVLDLPPLPLHVDVPAWLQIETVLDVLKGKDSRHQGQVPARFRNRVRGLLVPDDAGKLVSTGLEHVFRQRARQVAGKPELVIRAENSPLLEFLPPGELREKFLKLAAIGHLIWKGDRVPEMADHALRHHNDLLHLAERVLLPIYYYRPQFLEPHELYTLLCALFLHDCGHVVGSTPVAGNRRLLPTEVRDHHHVLGFLRLKDPEGHGGTGKAIYGELRAGDETDDSLWLDYLAAPATVGLYHRKCMFLFTSDKSTPYPFFEVRDAYVQPLQEHLEILRAGGHPLSVAGTPLEFNRVALLVCLLRVIDGLDEKASRTGSPSDVAFHLAQLETETEEEKARGHALYRALSGLPNGKALLECIDTLLERRIGCYIEKEGKGHIDGEIEKKADGASLSGEVFLEHVTEALMGHHDVEPLFMEYIQSRLLSSFKEFQKVPYGEKVFIGDVIVKAEGDAAGGITIAFDLDMVEDPEAIEAYCRAGCPDTIVRESKVKGEPPISMNVRTPEGREHFRRYMLGKLEEEYTAEGGKVKEVLGDQVNKIRFVYGNGGCA